MLPLKSLVNFGKTFWMIPLYAKILNGRKFILVILNVQLRLSWGLFYFKIFHKPIALSKFLCKIVRKDTPMCAFCHNAPETIIHIFCDCEKVQPIWDGLISLIRDKFDPDCNLNKFDRLFGIKNEPLLSYLILCCKFYIYKCCFQNSTPNSTRLFETIIY